MSQDDMPPPIETRTPEQLMDAFFPNGFPERPTTPLAAAYLWWMAINLQAEGEDFAIVLQNLSLPGKDLDIDAVVAELANHSMLQFVGNDADATGHVAHVKFAPGFSRGGRAFDGWKIPNAKIVSVVLGEDDLWRVAAVTAGRVPTAAELADSGWGRR